MHQMLEQWVREAAERTEGIAKAEVEVVWEPAWNITMAADNVKQALGAMPTP
jgi:metal-sulfur cluster biosynthetic enzyme